MPVLVVDDLVAAAAVRPGGPRLGEHVPVRDLPARVLAPPLLDQYGTCGIFAPSMNDSPAASIACWFASLIMPASATMVRAAKNAAPMQSQPRRLRSRVHGTGMWTPAFAQSSLSSARGMGAMPVWAMSLTASRASRARSGIVVTRSAI